MGESVELESGALTAAGDYSDSAPTSVPTTSTTTGPFVLTDNVGSLSVENAETAVDDDGITGGDGVGDEDASDGIRAVVGDFRCPSSGFLGQGDQGDRTGTVTAEVRAESNDGSVTVEVDRSVEVDCIPE